MTRRLLLAIGVLCCVVFANPLSGNIIEVPGDYTTIQGGINAASDGDTVLVAEDTYYENINFRGKNIVVTSYFIVIGELSHIWNTIIDGSRSTEIDSGSCVSLVSGEDSTAVIQGFTLTRGTGMSFDVGGGVLYREGGGVILGNSSAMVKNNIIIENSAVEAPGALAGGGGGISSFYGNPRILNNVVMLNTAAYASGIVLNWSGGVIRNNLVYLNYGADQFGTGGVMVWESDPWSASVENNTIVGNTSLTTAGGLSVTNTSAYIRNNIIWGNRQRNGPQVTGQSASLLEFCSTEDGYSGQGNITSHPDFLPNNFVLSTLSPCVDGGAFNGAFNDVEDPGNPGYALYPSRGGLRNDIGVYGGPGVSAFPPVMHQSIYTPEEVAFSTVAIGDSSIQSIEILNLCTHNLTIDSITVDTGEGLTLDKVIEAETYGPIRADTLEIKWKPQQAGNLDTNLRIYHPLSFVSSPVVINISGTAEDPAGIGDEGQPGGIPMAFGTYQNFPNPFNPMTTIKYDLAEDTHVSLRIYNVKGRLVKTLVDGRQTKGQQAVVWNGKDSKGQPVSSGVYIYRMQAGDFQQSRKMLLVR